MNNNKFQIYLSSDRIFSNSEAAFHLENSKKLGEKTSEKIIYSPFEALFLVETNKAEITKGNKPLSSENLISLFSKKHKDFLTKYLVFKNLRNKGYIVKTGLKFGSEFRVYDKNNHNKHARWLVYPVKSEKINLDEFISKNRIAHSTGKKILLAIVDSEEKIIFYEINWLKI